jgi:3-oxoacyl-[acyl-carrier-protein] synthase II
MAMNTGIIPPTINLENTSENCRLNYAAHKAVERKLEAVMSNSFGFGGTNATLVFAKV